jgi:hypothetical protein
VSPSSSFEIGHRGEGRELTRHVGAFRLVGDLGHAFLGELGETRAEGRRLAGEGEGLDRVAVDDGPIEVVEKREVALVRAQVTLGLGDGLDRRAPRFAAGQRTWKWGGAWSRKNIRMTMP